MSRFRVRLGINPLGNGSERGAKGAGQNQDKRQKEKVEAKRSYRLGGDKSNFPKIDRSALRGHSFVKVLLVPGCW